ncbi:MAG: polysaccharide biosynthesis C-terminal domain-containing protein [Dehalococcoidales bacterium]|nr:polysaccharide biosynthesis C-terminal domain-containing protein [Dehalococcoidales bacterium]
MKLFKSPKLKTIAETTRANLSISGVKRLLSISLYRNSIFLIGDTALTSVFGFIFWVVAARFYTAAEVGSGSAIISSINLLAALSMVGLSLSTIRFLPRNDRPQHFINTCLTAVGIIALLAGVIFIAGLSVWSPALLFVRQDMPLLFTFLAIVVMITMLDLIDSVFVARRLSNLVFTTSTIMVVLRVIFLVALAFIVHSLGIVLSWGLSFLITIVISFALLLPRVQAGYKPVPVIDFKLLGSLSKYSLGSYIASLFSRAPSMILPLMVVNIVGAENNAYFYIAWTVAGFLSTIPMAVSRSLFAEGAHSDKNITGDVTRSLKFVFMISIPALVILVLAGKWILLAFGPGYADNALTLLWVLSLANLLRGVYSIYIGLLRIQDKIMELVLFQFISAIITVALSYWSIGRYGIEGVGYAWLIVQIVMAVVIGIRLYFWFKRYRNKPASTG